MTLATRGSDRIMPTYRRYPVTFVRGIGTRLYDDAGREYLDFCGGIAVAAIGHSHPRWVEAVIPQVAALAHVSNLFFTEQQVGLAERLAEISGLDSAFFANSGAEANEAALKLARRATGRTKVVTALGSFHGRTFATLAATGQPEKQAPFAPLPDWFEHVPFGDAEALEAAVDAETSAVLLEPVLGEGGVVPAPEGYLDAARRACDRTGALLILDEVQTGIGRCGDWLAHPLLGKARPDIVTLAKALGGGLPIGACLARDGLSFAAGEHASTFGGGPIVCAGALAVLEVIEAEGLLENCRAQAARLETGFRAQVPVAEVRGLGLLAGLRLPQGVAADAVVRGALEAGLVTSEAAGNVVRLTPPLTVTRPEVDRAVEILAWAVQDVVSREETG